jgi:hypothetical protein
LKIQTLVSLYKTSYLQEEVNCTEPSPSVGVPCKILSSKESTKGGTVVSFKNTEKIFYFKMKRKDPKRDYYLENKWVKYFLFKHFQFREREAGGDGCTVVFFMKMSA